MCATNPVYPATATEDRNHSKGVHPDNHIRPVKPLWEHSLDQELPADRHTTTICTSQPAAATHHLFSHQKAMKVTTAVITDPTAAAGTATTAVTSVIFRTTADLKVFPDQQNISKTIHMLSV